LQRSRVAPTITGFSMANQDPHFRRHNTSLPAVRCRTTDVDNLKKGPTMTALPDDETLAASWGAPRSRTVDWHAPGPSTAVGMTMPGIDYLRAMKRGALPGPPIADLMRIEAVEVEDGRVVVTCAPDESMYNAMGVIHGGVACTALDLVTGCAMTTILPAGKGIVTVEIKVNYLKVLRPSSGPLTATGTVVKAGSRLGFTEGTITDVSGVTVATASSTLLIVDA
jgi:uncharacterized protein (TIGR00369 family)